jgi:hypothetical protein
MGVGDIAICSNANMKNGIKILSFNSDEQKL